MAGRIRITERRIIADRYGHHAIAQRHRQLINAVLRSSFAQDADQPDPLWDRIVERLSERACRKYRQLVYETPEFLTYFEQATPIAEIGALKIASRPARRTAVRGIEQLRAIPWVFGWMQSRHTLPGWYGLGTAIDEHLAENPDDLPVLETMYRQWPFWRTLIDNAQMILAKSDLVIARLYADLVEDRELADRIFEQIAAEHARTVDVIQQITGQSELLERTPVLKTSIQRRNPYVDPLSFIQLTLLKRLRAGSEPREELLTAVRKHQRIAAELTGLSDAAATPWAMRFGLSCKVKPSTFARMHGATNRSPACGSPFRSAGGGDRASIATDLPI